MLTSGVDAGPLEIKKNPWVKWFAWRPVRINGKITWFKKIYRQEIPKTYANYDDWTRYRYGTILDVLKNDPVVYNGQVPPKPAPPPRKV